MTVDELLESVEHGYAENDGVKIHYATLGDGPLMVMVHGFPDFWLSWRYQMPAMARHFKVAAVDLRGYNLSDKPKGADRYRMPLLVADIEAVIRRLGYASAVVVGHDWGGMVSWAAAIKRPELVERLVICNLPHPRALERELATNPRQREASEYAVKYQREGAHSGLTPEKLSKWYEPEVAHHYVRAFERSDIECMLHYYKANFPGPPYSVPESPIAKVECPVLMIHGLEDRALMPECLNGTWDWLERDLTLVTVPGAGHFVQHDARKFVTRQFERWLDL